MITLTVEDINDLERILEALETQACHHEMDAAWASADICRMLAQGLSTQDPAQSSEEHSHQPSLECEIQMEDSKNGTSQDYEAWLDSVNTELEKSPYLKQLIKDLSDAFLNGSRADFMEQMETVSILAGHI